MTSKENTERPVTPAARLHFKDRSQRHALIRGGVLPDLDDLLGGAPWCGDRIESDIQAWCDAFLLTHGTDRKTAALRRALEGVRVLRSTCSLATVSLVEPMLDPDDALRMRIYRACLGDREAALAVAEHIADDARGYHGGYDGMWPDCVALGLLMRNRRSMDDYCLHGSAIMQADTNMLDDYFRASNEAAAEARVASEAKKNDLLADVRGVSPDDEDFLQAVLEDRAEFWQPSKPEAIVVPLLPEAQTGARKELYKSWRGIDSVPLPIVLRGDVGAHRRSLVQRWPHAADVIDTILTDLAAREEVRFKPTLLVGKPGSGKSALARAICDQLGLPCELFSMAGVHDAALMGTSAQWHSARVTLPLQLIKRTKTASVGVIWDEAEKADPGRNNGSATEALLPMLEIDQARRYRDLALEVEVDLSWVSHFATANSLDGVPAPLRDRMRVLTMPEPTWQHVGALSRQIIRRLAHERGIDERWFEPLAEDELELVRQAWPGGSIRQLTHIVTTILDGRQAIMGRA